ncbi:GntR family transcriptional regulator [Pseudorhodoplanes sinuspersici]|uniref:Transcriptional regulator n=1 Tax=Pseudorhodoplanes sinuspersici TaxID=1235591 RepID=A0A1W6ZML1_9HYPH|nr:transcriptional regulator [Pseudorhodoplanes sinuspersici]RKE66152.1 GntR family transcriptional regulator [Pseudorhodoplanes sinuspersici]
MKKRGVAALAQSAVLKQSGETLADVLHRELEQAILKGDIKPGDRLDEHEIAQRYGVSRTPVREAFRLLGANDLVDLRSRQGVVVRKVGINTVLEMFQVMAELEGLCARLASRRMTPAQEAEMRRIHERLTESATGSDVDEFHQVNIDFHAIIHDSARNAFLAQEVGRLRARMAPYLRRVTYKPHRFQTTVAEHETIIVAICAHDAEKAHATMRLHVSLLGDDLADFIAAYE